MHANADGAAPQRPRTLYALAGALSRSPLPYMPRNVCAQLNAMQSCSCLVPQSAPQDLQGAASGTSLTKLPYGAGLAGFAGSSITADSRKVVQCDARSYSEGGTLSRLAPFNAVAPQQMPARASLGL